MAAIDFKRFEKEVADPKPVYMVKSGQDYLVRKIFRLCESQVPEGARGFDWNVFEAGRDESAEIVGAARTLPWMSPRRWVWVRNAEEGGEELARYLNKPSPRTVIMLEASRRGKGWPGKLPTLGKPGGVPPQKWVAEQAEAEGYSIDRRAAQRLVELAGEDLQQLHSELEKQFLYCLQSKRISVEAVNEMTRQTRDYDVFSLIGAIADRDSRRALTILGRLFEAGHSPPALVALLYWNYRRLLAAKELLEERRMPFWDVLKKLKIWSYKNHERQVRSYPRPALERMLLRLRETDRLLKSTSADERAALERLVAEACE